MVRPFEKDRHMDTGVVAAVIVMVLLLVAILSTSFYIGKRLQVDPVVVIVVGILFWPAWLVMLLVAAGKTEHNAPVSVHVAPGVIRDSRPPYPSLSDTALAGRPVGVDAVAIAY
jgi:hypothetical protein